ncbi:hypothetical protein VTG60DRAFT_6975 [Thermothelomyces hinnuleus]
MAQAALGTRDPGRREDVIVYAVGGPDVKVLVFSRLKTATGSKPRYWRLHAAGTRATVSPAVGINPQSQIQQPPKQQSTTLTSLESGGFALVRKAATSAPAGRS